MRKKENVLLAQLDLHDDDRCERGHDQCQHVWREWVRNRFDEG